MFEARDQRHVLCDGKVGKEPGFLNDISDAAAKADGVGAGGGLAVNEDLA